MTARKLVLRRERLAELDPGELRHVAGAATRERSCQTWQCESNLVICASIDDPCPSIPLRPCLSMDGGASCACFAAG